MGLNWSAGFGGAAQGLSQAVNVTAQQQLEDMKDQRAENLARLSFQWKEQHDTNVADRQDVHDSNVLDRQHQITMEGAKYSADREDSRNTAALQREGLILGEAGRRQQAALDAASARQDQQLTKAEELQRRQQLFQLQDQMRKDAADMDIKEQRLRTDLQKGLASNPFIATEQDPVKKADFIAKDPTLSGIANDLADLKLQRKRSAADFVMRSADLGDPRFQGVTDAQLGTSKPSTSAMPPPLNGTDPTSGLLTQPTVGPQPDPITNSIGPLSPKPSLIPFGPNANTTPSLGSGLGASDPGTDPTQPSLIQ